MCPRLVALAVVGGFLAVGASGCIVRGGRSVGSYDSQLRTIMATERKPKSRVGRLDAELRAKSDNAAVAISDPPYKLIYEGADGETMCFRFVEDTGLADKRDRLNIDRWVRDRKRAKLKLRAHDRLVGGMKWDVNTAGDAATIEYVHEEIIEVPHKHNDGHFSYSYTGRMTFRACAKQPVFTEGSRYLTVRIPLGSDNGSLFVWSVDPGAGRGGVDETPTATAVTTPLEASSANKQTSAAPGSIVATLQADGNFTQFLRALGETDVGERLSGPGPFTVFAPTDAAFDNLSPKALEHLFKDTSKLAKKMRSHVVDGNLSAAALSRTSEVRALSGKKLKIKQEGDKLRIGRASAVGPERATTNGVIFVVDALLD